jgi:S1-C subfamily serine protease
LKKRILSFLLITILVLGILPTYAFAAGTLSNFVKTKTYKPGQFTDVPSNQWYAPNVQAAYEYGLIDGSTQTTFSPGNNLTLAEAIKLAACLHSIFTTGAANFAKNSVWYQPYVDYALTNGIIAAPYASYTAYAKRSDMAVIFAHALPDEAMTLKNTIDDNAIPDVSVSLPYSPEVYKLYRAGVLTGSDKGVFHPDSNITRDAVAAIVSRMANESLRLPLTLVVNELSSVDIAAKCSPAVFFIELLNKDGETIRSGSGFFINSKGLAVTNYHVIRNMIAAKVTLEDGKSYEVAGVVDYSADSDLALIQINGTDFPFLSLADSDSVTTGASITAIGYPLGVDQTVTSGTITNASHLADGVKYIMINAAISNGNSGGALINAAGKVIGVTSASYSNGQNLNLAVPINLLKSLSSDKPVISLSKLFTRTYTYYANYTMIPDFASVTGSLLEDDMYDKENKIQSYLYAPDPSQDIYEVRELYLDQLDLEGFSYQGSKVIDGNYFYAYTDPTDTWVMAVGIAKIDGKEYIMLMIMHTEK